MYRLIHAPRRKKQECRLAKSIGLHLYGVGGEMAQDVVAVA